MKINKLNPLSLSLSLPLSERFNKKEGPFEKEALCFEGNVVWLEDPSSS